jgi:hypothetical protein
VGYMILPNINCIQVFGTQGTYTNFGFVVPLPVDAGLFFAAGQPNDVSGWTITFRVKYQASDLDSAAIVLHTFTIEDGTNGVIQDGVTPEINSALPPQNYYWSMTASIGGGPAQELFSGAYTLSPGP